MNWNGKGKDIVEFIKIEDSSDCCISKNKNLGQQPKGFINSVSS